jgi:vacuolar-type H+-ATPase subunit I/STV1
MVFWFGIVPVVLAIHKYAQLEQRALSSPLSYWAMTGTVAAAAFAARLVSNTGANRSEPGIRFEESASDELIGLGLNG